MAERISYLTEDELTLDPEPVKVGDIVKTGPNDYPRFQIIAIDSGRAWLRNIVTGEDAVVGLDDCCWRVREGEGGDQRIGRTPRQPAPSKVGPEAPVEPTRIDRLLTPDEDSQPRA